ncbi:hypothetical protein VIGAN_03208200 [Vigna angularis var. angularis]|uniref:Uncharacterized protein n=1 Tax=Vigna angularis var. angularis TaxID=157739 RepID=A0A0S3RNI3_PHAAN|nr:hypothetical protein VIGAN_03208200 [Vigna angularis var. angularis]
MKVATIHSQTNPLIATAYMSLVVLIDIIDLSDMWILTTKFVVLAMICFYNSLYTVDHSPLTSELPNAMRNCKAFQITLSFINRLSCYLK